MDIDEISPVVVYAAGDGWTADIPAGEWDAMDLAVRTSRIAMAWLLHAMPPDRSERERVFAGVDDPGLADQLWAAWGQLPETERAICRAVGVTVATGALEPGAAGLCESSVWRNDGIVWFARHRITIDPAQSEDPVKTMYHEIAHAVYRHGVQRLALTSAGVPAGQPDAMHEVVAEVSAGIWRAMARNGV